MQHMTLREQTRRRAYLYLSPEVAAIGGMSLQQMQHFIARQYEPEDECITALARRMSLPRPLVIT